MARAMTLHRSPAVRTERAPKGPGRRCRAIGPVLLTMMVVVATAASCSSRPPAESWWAFNELRPGAVIWPATDTEVPDSSRNGYGLRMHPVSDAAIVVVDHARQGSALQFPPTGQAALTLPDTAEFDPGSRDFEVSVWIAVTADQIGPDGANVVQKGLATGSQWKIQVDGGFPACGYIDTDGRSVLWAGRPSTPVTDGAWYRVTCRKTSTDVSLSVQRIGGILPRPDVERVTLGAISNDAPVTVGSKGTPTEFDQFRGRIDNLTIRVY